MAIRLVCCAQLGYVASPAPKMQLLAKLRPGGLGQEDINRLSLSEATFIITLRISWSKELTDNNVVWGSWEGRVGQADLCNMGTNITSWQNTAELMSF